MNIFEIEKLPSIKEDEIINILKENENVRIERIISTGQVSDWMIQENKEYVLLIQGIAIIEFNDKKVEMKAGDTLFIEKLERHRVSYTSENPCCIWFCIHF
jgi:cupin 2 barrel domain protein